MIVLTIGAQRSAAADPVPATIYLPTTVLGPPVGRWETIPTTPSATPRHENGFVMVGGAFYLVGGRSAFGVIKPVERFDPATATWATLAPPPTEIHHFQAVVFNDLIYVMGAYQGDFPYETAVDRIYIYDPAANAWFDGGPIARPRGSAGAVAHNGRIYLVGGIVGGHGPQAQVVDWFDEYDPATGTWRELPPIPHPRDHFYAAVADGKLFAAAGRDTGVDGDFNLANVAEIDVYDFAADAWQSLPAVANLPTPRAGAPTAVLGSELLVIGGEGNGRAWPNVEALDWDTHRWRRLTDLNRARHGTQTIVCADNIYIVAGSGAQGGAPELASMERFSLSEPVPCHDTD